MQLLSDYFGIVCCCHLLCVSGVKLPLVLEKKPASQRRMHAYSSRSTYNRTGRTIKGRGPAVSVFHYMLVSPLYSIFG